MGNVVDMTAEKYALDIEMAKKYAYLRAEIDTVQEMFDELDFVSIDMIAVALGVSLKKYKARQAEIMKEDLENDVD